MHGLKTGGRQKGTPNRRTQDLLEKVRERWPDYHPVLAMIDLAHEPDLPIELRFQCHKEVAHYIEPKRKAVEVSGGLGMSHEAWLEVLDSRTVVVQGVSPGDVEH